MDICFLSGGNSAFWLKYKFLFHELPTNTFVRQNLFSCILNFDVSISRSTFLSLRKNVIKENILERNKPIDFVNNDRFVLKLHLPTFIYVTISNKTIWEYHNLLVDRKM